MLQTSEALFHSASLRLATPDEVRQMFAEITESMGLGDVLQQAADAEGVEHFVELAYPERDQRSIKPLEQLSKLVSIAGASNLREFAKRVAFRRNTDLRRRLATSANPANAYRTDPIGNDDIIVRDVKAIQTNRSRRQLALDSTTALHHFDAPICALAPELAGFTILHLSDVHFKVGNKQRIEEMRALVDHLIENQIHIDLVVLTGDIVTTRPEDLCQEALDQLDRIPAHVERVVVYGNHDFYNQGITEVRAMMDSIGYRDLTNSHMRVILEGQAINIFGVDDHLEGVPKVPILAPHHHAEANILVTHNLDAVQLGFPQSFDLTLSGHTHGGEVQIGPFNGSQLMRAFRYLDVLNGHVGGWSPLTRRNLSYISPGHASHFFRMGTNKPGGTILKLQPTALELAA